MSSTSLLDETYRPIALCSFILFMMRSNCSSNNKTINRYVIAEIKDRMNWNEERMKCKMKDTGLCGSILLSWVKSKKKAFKPECEDRAKERKSLVSEWDLYSPATLFFSYPP